MGTDEILLAISKLAGAELRELLARLRQIYPENFPLNDRERGRQVEEYICNLVNGKLMPPQSAFDIETLNGVRLEVKYSKLSEGKGEYGTVRSWTWGSVLGKSHGKIYERLILVAEPNPACKLSYPDPTGKYVLFDVPFEELSALIKGEHKQLILNSDQSRIWKTKDLLLRLYTFAVTPRQMIDRYGQPDYCS